MKKSFIALITVVIGTYLLFSHFFTDIQINKYQDLQTAKKHQAIKKGWVPALLPPSAYEIEETHNIDSNEVFGRFKYKEQDEKRLMQQLQPIIESNGTYMWKDFLFRPDTKTNTVKYRNKPSAQ